jgi:hypothetical protein
MAAHPSSGRPPFHFYPLVRRRSPRSKIRATARWLALIAITQQISCAGGGGGATNSNFDPAPAASVSISPPSAQLSAGASVQFTAIVQNASNPAVTWEVNGIRGGNASVGTIAASGATTASYTAPANLSGVLTVTIAAVLQVDSSKGGSATLTIDPPLAPSITISPANSTVVTGGSVQFAANVQNAPQAVVWEVNGIQLGTPASGTISATGFYAAPSQIPSPSVVTITALLQTNPSVSASTTLTIVSPPVSLSISPTTANVASGGSQQFTATVQNSSAPVTWEVNGISGGGQADGTIASTGSDAAAYTAPTVTSPLTVTVTAVLQSDPSIAASSGVTVLPSNTFAGVYSWRNDNNLTGQNSQESTLAPSRVSPTTFGKLFGCAVDGAIFAQPLYVANVTIASVPHNVVYVATENDTVYAFDAGNLCQTVWRVSLIDPNATAVPASDIPGQTDIVPEIGITGTPVIDPATATLYVVAKTKSIQNGSPVYTQKLHALDLTSGTEKFGGPATVQATVTGIGSGTVNGGIAFDPLTENQRAALLLTGGNVYVAFDSYDDTDPFHGWLFAYNAGNLQAPPVVFNTTPNGSRGGIGESGAAPSSDANGNIFVATSDGTFDANTSGNDYAETLLKLQVSASSFSFADSFTPSNELTLNLTQKYFGSSGVLLLPDALGGSAHPNLALTADRAGNLYLLDRNNLGGFNSGGPLQTTSFSGAIFGTPAFWSANNSVYVAAAGDNLRALPLSNGILGSPSCSTPNSCSPDTFGLFGASPVISWDGTNAGSGMVWALDTSGYVTPAPAILCAYDASNLSNPLYSSSATAGDPQAAGPAVKFAVPTVANGKVYVGTQGELSVFGLLP